MTKIVLLSGSPSGTSRSEVVLAYLGNRLLQRGITAVHRSVRDIAPADLVTARFDSPAVQELTSLLAGADGFIIASPVYKASYSGVLKALLDLLPPDILQDKPVLPLMSGGSQNHLLALEYSLKPLLASLKGQNLKGVYLIDHQIDKDSPAQPIKDAALLERLEQQVGRLITQIERQGVILA